MAEQIPKKKATKKQKQFAKNQNVVYPSQGIGKITAIEKLTFKGEKVDYYILYIDSNNMTIKIPVNRAKELGLRAIVSKKEADSALSILKQDIDTVSSDWKQRYQISLTQLKEGSIQNIAGIVHSLYNRKLTKELPIFERKLYDSALQLLIDEIAIVSNISKIDAEEKIFQILEEQVAMNKIENTIEAHVEDDGNENEHATVDEKIDDDADEEDADDADADDADADEEDADEAE